MPPTPPLVAAIYEEELTRLARTAVDLRANRVYRMLVPLTLVAALHPTLPRVLILAVVAVALVWRSKRDAVRMAEAGPTVALGVANARLLAAFHGVFFLLTGGLASPFLPIAVAFTFAVTLLLGPGRTLTGFLAWQVGIVTLLAVAQITGVSAELSPAWLVTPLTLPHSLVVPVVFATLLFVASRIALKMRSIFDLVLARVSEARSDLLASHRAQAEELTALSGAIAHELKNPLASVKGLGALLARDLPEGKPAERLGVLRREVDRMQTILEEFLTFSRPLVPAVAERTDLRALCEDVAALHEGLVRERGLRIEVHGAGTASVDPRKTRQVLINLVQNAVEASPAGGMVSLRADATGVVVEDQGPGPDPALGGRIFEAGVTTKATGNGLGLTIARAVARQQGGDLALTARPGGGARATLQLPGVP